MDKIKAETTKDNTPQKLSHIMRKGDWLSQKRDPIKDELYEARGLIYGMNRIVLPENIQQKMIKITHEMGHLRMHFLRCTKKKTGSQL